MTNTFTFNLVFQLLANEIEKGRTQILASNGRMMPCSVFFLIWKITLPQFMTEQEEKFEVCQFSDTQYNGKLFNNLGKFNQGELKGQLLSRGSRHHSRYM